MSSETSLSSTMEPVKIKLSSRLTELADTRSIQSLIDENAQSLHKNSDIQSKFEKVTHFDSFFYLYYSSLTSDRILCGIYLCLPGE